MGQRFYYSRITEQPLAEIVEQLKIKHRLMRDAMDAVNDLLTVSLGFTLYTLCLMALFDIYFHVTNWNPSKKQFFIFMWLFQYSLRFYMIVKAAEITTI